MITSDHPDDRQRGRHGLEVKVRAVRRGSNVEIWLFDGEHPMQRGTVVKAALVADAGRRGQDLVDDLIGNALHDIERYGETSALSLRPRISAYRRDRRLQLRSAS